MIARKPRAEWRPHLENCEKLTPGAPEDLAVQDLQRLALISAAACPLRLETADRRDADHEPRERLLRLDRGRRLLQSGDLRPDGRREQSEENQSGKRGGGAAYARSPVGRATCPGASFAEGCETAGSGQGILHGIAGKTRGDGRRASRLGARLRPRRGSLVRPFVRRGHSLGGTRPDGIGSGRPGGLGSREQRTPNRSLRRNRLAVMDPMTRTVLEYVAAEYLDDEDDVELAPDTPHLIRHRRQLLHGLAEGVSRAEVRREGARR